MRVKEGVKLGPLKPQMVLACLIAEPILNRYGQEGVITSGADGRHATRNSKHYIGYALDFRHRDMRNIDKQRAANMIQESLGEEYYVKNESTHIHVQYNGSLT